MADIISIYRVVFETVFSVEVEAESTTEAYEQAVLLRDGEDHTTTKATIRKLRVIETE